MYSNVGVLTNDWVIIFNNPNDIIEDKVEDIILIREIKGKPENRHSGAACYKKEEIVGDEVKLWQVDTFKTLFDLGIISHSYIEELDRTKNWLLGHVIQMKRDIPLELLDYLYESGTYDIEGWLTLVENLETAKWLWNKGARTEQCPGYPDAFEIWDIENNKELSDYFKKVIQEETTKKEHWYYLERLRRSGETNMYGAAPYLMRKFSLTYDESVKVLCDWMKNYNRDDYKDMPVVEDEVFL